MQLICGVVAGGVAGTLVTPLDIVKMRVLGGHGGRSVGQVIKKVAEEEGADILTKGSFSISIIRNSLDKGIQVWVYGDVEVQNLKLSPPLFELVDSVFVINNKVLMEILLISAV